MTGRLCTHLANALAIPDILDVPTSQPLSPKANAQS